MNNVHIMLDLETWGRTPGSDIRSIGAVVFNPVAGTVGMECSACEGGRAASYGDGGNCSDCLNTRTDHRGEFYVATENPLGEIVGVTDKLRAYPLTRDPETVQWWNDQSAEAQAAFANPVDLREACLQFALWLEVRQNLPGPTIRYPDFKPSENVRLWCNGPHFDEAILAAVYRAVRLPVPWHYRAPRDFRTITEAAGMTSADYCNYGEAHNALDDAIAQAMTVCEAYKRLGLQRV